MKKKTYYTTSAIIAAIAAIFFGVPALSYKEKRKNITLISDKVMIGGGPIYESFIQYTIRYWKELFVKPLQTTTNDIDSPKETTKEPIWEHYITSQYSPEVAKRIEEALYGRQIDKIMYSGQQ